MTYLIPSDHAKWIKERFLEYRKSFHGLSENEYESRFEEEWLDGFPVIYSYRFASERKIFRAVLKLTYEELPAKVFFSDNELASLPNYKQLINQVMILRLNKEGSVIDKAVYAMHSITLNGS